MSGLGKKPKLLSPNDSLLAENSGRKRKGPAEAATSPSRGSTNPQKDQNVGTNSTSKAGTPDFPIPHINQGPGDDLRDAMALFDILDHHFDAGASHGITAETVCDIATVFSTARDFLRPLHRYLDSDDRPGTIELYRAARRAEILASFQRGQA